MNDGPLNNGLEKCHRLDASPCFIYSDFLGYLCCYFGELGMMDPPGNDHIFVGSTHPHPVTGFY